MHFSKFIILCVFLVYFCCGTEINENHVAPKNLTSDYRNWNIHLDNLDVSVGIDGSSVSGNVQYSDKDQCLLDIIEHTLRLKCGCSVSPIDAYFFSAGDGDMISCLITPVKESCSLFYFYYGCAVVDQDTGYTVTFEAIDTLTHGLGMDRIWVYVIFVAIVALILGCCIWCCCCCCHCGCYKRKSPEYLLAEAYSKV